MNRERIVDTLLHNQKTTSDILSSGATTTHSKIIVHVHAIYMSSSK